MKTSIGRTALASIAVLFLLGGSTAAFANTQQSGQQTLSLTIPAGVVTNLGAQFYTVSGGTVAFAMIAGQTIDPGASLKYSLHVSQFGLSTWGYASVSLSGTTGGIPISMVGTFTINNNVPAAVIGNSELPFFFVTAPSNVQVTIAGSTQTVPETLDIESPYFNPFGAPIAMASPDGAIVIAATYTQGTILWIGSQVTGQLIGTLGTTPVTGTFSLTSSEFENLVTGNAQDTGSISFSSMTPSSLNANGFYTGSSTIPTAGAIDCSMSATGIPGTCTETGFQSSGSFSAGEISGKYATSWGIPALGFYSTISATVSQGGNSQGGNSQG